MPIEVTHNLARDDLALGLVSVGGVAVADAVEGLAAELHRWIEQRASASLSPEEDEVRKRSRDILRNGSYKPTGRGKPASEYLLRTVKEGSFPRINGPVDANNLVSLQHCVAISLWDPNLAGVDRYEFRLGAPDEEYVFNPTGQTLSLKDLVCGCALDGDGSRPIVTPIKDSMATKIVDGTTRVAGCIYYPLAAGGEERAGQVAQEFLRWLRTCGESPQGNWAVGMPGATVEV